MNTDTKLIELIARKMPISYYGYIYMTINTINNKLYISKHAITNKQSHYDIHNNGFRIDPNYIGSGRYFRKAVRKYGVENFITIIFDYASDLTELNRKETFWIKFFDAQTNPMYYNIGSGGEKNDNLSKHPNKEEISKKKSKKLKGKKHTPEWNKKIGDGRRGHKFSEEWKQQRSIQYKNNPHCTGGSKGYKWTEEQCNNQSITMKNFYKTEKGKIAIQKSAEKHKGKIPWNKGLKLK